MESAVIVSIGEVLWDLFPDAQRFGGAPANFACHAAIHGADVSILSAVGDDRRGSEAIDILRRYGIDTGLIQVIPDASTGTVGVAIDSAGKPSFTIHEDSAWDRIRWTDQIEARIKEADAVYLGTLGQRSNESRGTIRRCVEVAREAGIPRLVDINLRAPFFDDELIRESIALASMLKLSDDELPEIISACGIRSSASTADVLRLLLDSYALDLVVMTCGAQGATLASRDGIVTQKGIQARVKDTVGAGDSFAAAFLLGVLRGEPKHQTLHKACAIAAAACSHSGAVPLKP